MDARRLKLKIFVERPEQLQLERLVPVFYGWIRERKLDEPMIDVVDYRHVPDGPGVVLIGHESDYSLDQSGGRPGLCYRRKRRAPDDPGERLVDAFRRAFSACRLLEEDAALQGRLRFCTGEILLQIPDRLDYPNTVESYESIRPGLEAFLSRLYAGARVTLSRHGSPHEQLGVAVRVAGAPALDVLMDRLGVSTLAA